MKPIKPITIVAAVWCVLAVLSARAQTITNAATVTVVAYEEGNITTNSSGSATTYTMVKKMYNTAQLLEEINTAITTNKFSTAAKLVLIATNDISAPSFAVIDGTNFYDLSPAGYNIINPGAGDPVKSGTESNTGPERKLTEADFYSIYYNDTRYFTNANEGLEFYLSGLEMFTESDTARNGAGDNTESFKASVPNLTGEGHNGTNYFFMTGMISAAGNARQ